MSGHSKWNTIKRQKETNDKKRAQVFSKLLRAVAVAAKDGGNDPQANPKLRIAIDRARAFNVPKQNIERALEKTSGAALEAFAIDAIGPGGTVFLIEGTTDNRNRTIHEIRKILESNAAKFAQEGAARWAFVRKGILAVERPGSPEARDAIGLTAITAGAEDVRESDEAIEVITEPERLASVRSALEDRNVSIADATVGWIPQHPIVLSENNRLALQRLTDVLDEHDDVETVWSNES